MESSRKGTLGMLWHLNTHNMTFTFQNDSDDSDADRTLSYVLESVAPAATQPSERVRSRGDKSPSRSWGRGRKRKADTQSGDRGGRRERSARRAKSARRARAAGSGRSRGRSGVRGRRVQHGQIRLEEGDEERIRQLQEERTSKKNVR